MSENGLGQFNKKNYINIESYRKSGEAVKTPVWFVEEGGVLYVSTGAKSGKVKRIRRNPTIKVVPCSMSGNPQGAWVSASAEIVADQTLSSNVETMLEKKYGLQKKLLELFSRGDKAETAVVKIQFTN